MRAGNVWYGDLLSPLASAQHVRHDFEWEFLIADASCDCVDIFDAKVSLSYSVNKLKDDQRILNSQLYGPCNTQLYMPCSLLYVIQ